MTRNRSSRRDPHAIKDAEQSAPRTDAVAFANILEQRLSRRDTLRGGLSLAATTFFAGAGLSACSDSNNGPSGSVGSKLTFDSIAGSSADTVSLPAGYEMQVLIPWGSPINGATPAFNGDGTNTAADQALQIGANHDGMTFFPLPAGSTNSDRGLLVVNHEYTNATLFAGDGRTEDADGNPTDPDEVRKDINAHGVSVVEIQRDSGNNWSLVSGGFNRRITAATPMNLAGPAAGSPLMVTAFDNTGMTTRGTVNNCGRGFTPWGTYLATEENIQGYFTTTEDPVPEEKDRYGFNANGFGYKWAAVAGDAGEVNDEFARFNIAPTGATAADDYRNEANTFGWLVEIDPYDTSAIPTKRTAVGRFRHEGAEPGRVIAGRPIAWYMGDDARFDYFYKFVSNENWDPADATGGLAAGNKYLDNGTLYVARFGFDGAGEWLELDISNPDLAARFSSQAEVLTYARIAADILGATPMDRPEWSTTDPNTGEIYLTLTNNTRRPEGDENLANPRAPNSHGHIIRLGETDDDPAATTFTWDIFAFGSNATADSAFNLSGLTLDNEFGSPDGLWFDKRGVLWIQTDNGAPLDSGTNDQMLAVIPADLGGDRQIRPDTQAQLKRFFVGPKDCEVTGVEMTPDYRTMFVNIQHPGNGDATVSNFPGGAGTRPRSATVVITRSDGGEIAL